MRKSCPSSPVYHSIIYLYQYGLVNMYAIPWVIMQSYCYLLFKSFWPIHFWLNALLFANKSCYSNFSPGWHSGIALCEKQLCVKVYVIYQLYKESTRKEIVITSRIFTYMFKKINCILASRSNSRSMKQQWRHTHTWSWAYLCIIKNNHAFIWVRYHALTALVNLWHVVWA